MQTAESRRLREENIRSGKTRRVKIQLQFVVLERREKLGKALRIKIKVEVVVLNSGKKFGNYKVSSEINLLSSLHSWIAYMDLNSVIPQSIWEKYLSVMLEKDCS